MQKPKQVSMLIKEWKAVADSEFDSLMANEIWEVVKLLSSH